MQVNVDLTLLESLNTIIGSFLISLSFWVCLLCNLHIHSKKYCVVAVKTVAINPSIICHPRLDSNVCQLSGAKAISRCSPSVEFPKWCQSN